MCVVKIDGDVSGTVKFALPISVTSKEHDRLSFGVEDVHSVIVALGDYDSSLRIQSETTWSFQLP